MSVVENIESLNINDSILMEVRILGGVIEMVVDYIDDYDLQKSSIRRLVFKQCESAEFRINPNCDSPNSLLAAEELVCSKGRHIKIITNTTSEEINIHCSAVYIE